MRVDGVSHILYRIYDRDAAINFFVHAFGCELLERGTIIYAIIGDVLIEMIDNDPAVEAEALSDRYMFGVSVDSLEGSYSPSVSGVTCAGRCLLSGGFESGWFPGVPFAAAAMDRGRESWVRRAGQGACWSSQ